MIDRRVMQHQSQAVGSTGALLAMLAASAAHDAPGGWRCDCLDRAGGPAGPPPAPGSLLAMKGAVIPSPKPSAIGFRRLPDGIDLDDPTGPDVQTYVAKPRRDSVERTFFQPGRTPSPACWAASIVVRPGRRASPTNRELPTDRHSDWEPPFRRPVPPLACWHRAGPLADAPAPPRSRRDLTLPPRSAAITWVRSTGKPGIVERTASSPGRG